MKTGYGPLNGIRVVDFTHAMAGPACALMLADMGAEVIKIERAPFEADEARNASDPYSINGVSATYMILNRNKKTLPLDLKSPEGSAVAKKVLLDADVVLENFRPGVLERLGLSYENICEFNPQIIYGAISGFGRTGPYKVRAGFDLIAQGMSGIMSVTGEGPGRRPVKPGVPMTDITAGILLAMGICAALRHREVTGEGQMVDTSLFEAGIVQTYWHSAIAFATGLAPEPLGSGHPLNAPYQALQTEDGWITVGAANGPTWKRFAEIVDPDMLEDPRFCTNEARMENLKVLEQHLNNKLSARTTEAWLDLLEQAGVPAGPINTIVQMHDDPQALAREMVVTQSHPDAGPVKTLGLPVKFSQTPGGPKQPASRYGEHTRSILRDVGYTDEEISTFIRSGVTVADEQSPESNSGRT